MFAELIAESITHNDTYFQKHFGPLAIALLVSAMICWLLGQKLRRAEARVAMAREPLHRTSRPRSFLNIEHWAYILFIVAGWLLVQELVSVHHMQP
jgi:hypothetical protein